MDALQPWQAGVAADPTVVPPSAAPAAPAAQPAPAAASWTESPLTPDQVAAMQGNPAGPQPYAQSVADSVAWEGDPNARYPAPTAYIRVDPQTGAQFLRQRSDGGVATASGASTDGGTAASANLTGNQQPPDASPGAADWRQGTPADGSGDPATTPQAQKALADARAALPFKNDADIGAWKAIQGATFNLGDELAGGLDAAKVGIANAFGKGPGYSAGDAYRASVQATREKEAGYDQRHPVVGTGLTIAGSLANPLNWTGGEFIGGADGLGSAALRSSAIGAGTGALYGVGAGGDDLGSRFGSGAQGAQAGAVAGLAVPFLGAAASPVINPVLAATRRAGAGAMTTAADTLAGLGIDIRSLPGMAQTNISQGVSNGLHPGDVAIQQAAQGLPVPVPMSRGQITGDPVQQLTENMIYRGGRSPAAARQAQSFKQEQQLALRGNVDQIGADMNGGFPVARGQAGESVSDALNRTRDTAWGQVGGLYDAARAAPDAAYLHADDAHQLVRAAQSGMADFDPLNVPRVAREVGRLRDQMTPWAGQLPEGVDPARVSRMSGAQQPANVRTLFDARARLTHLRGSNDPVESAAAGSVVHALDQQINSALTDDLFQGDPKTVQMWRSAIASRRDFADTFERGDLVDKLTARQGVGQNARLKVDAHDASNYIFGRSALGWVGRQNLYTGLQRLKGVLGPQSEAWNRLRGEAFARIAGAGDGPMEAGTPQFSGAKFAQAWGKAKSEDPHLMASLFTDHERATIDTFAAVAARVTKPVTGGDNASNSGITAARAFGALKRLPFPVIEALPFLGHLADKIDSVAAQQTIRQATYRAAPRRVVPPASAAMGQILTPPLAIGAEELRRRYPAQR